MKTKYLETWNDFFNQEQNKEYWKQLMVFVDDEFATKTIYPIKENVFKLYETISPDDVKVVIIGQDPYHQPNQANGIAFSATNNVATPRSLKNIFKELNDDLKVDHFQNNDLTRWVEQGVFLINTVLTVEESNPNSHKGRGWEEFTTNTMNYLNQKNDDIVYVLFGKSALNVFEKLTIKPSIDPIIVGHPSPLSYNKHFKGTKPFSQINNKLKTKIDWSK